MRRNTVAFFSRKISAHVFPWGRKHIVGLILSPLKNFEFSENLRCSPGRTLTKRLKINDSTVSSEAMKLCNKIISSLQKFADKYDLQRYPSRRKMGNSRVARVPEEKFRWENV